MDAEKHDWKRTYRNILNRMRDSEGRYRVKTDGPEAAVNLVYAMYRYHGGKAKRDEFGKAMKEQPPRQALNAG